MDIISRITKSFGDLTGRSKRETLEESLDRFEDKINKVVADLISPYIENKTTNDKRFIELLNLLDPKKCNKIAMTMASNLEKSYTTIELEGYAQKIFVGQEKGSECLDDTCEQLNDAKLKGKTKDIPKKELCEAISLHYVKILNLIAAILTAVNPANNLCVKRLNDLFTLVDGNSRIGISKICEPGVSDKSILDDPGVRELIILYYFYTINEMKNPAARRTMDMQFKKLIFDLEKITYDPNAEPEEESPVPNSKASAANIREKLKNLKAEVKNLNNSDVNKEIDVLNEQINEYQNNYNDNDEETPTNNESSLLAGDKIINNNENDNTESESNANDSNNINERESFENNTLGNENTVFGINAANNENNNTESESNLNNRGDNSSEIIEKYGQQPKRQSEIQTGGDNNENDELVKTAVNDPDNEEKEIFGNIPNNTPNNKTILTPDENNMDDLESSKKSSKAIKKFIEFTNKYQPVKDISPNVVSVIKKAFKKSDGTAYTDQQFQSFCDKYDKTGTGISVSADDHKFMKYIAVFKEMKQYYISTCNTLLDILEEDILALQKANPPVEGDEGEYKIKNIKYEDLAEIESKVRLTIGELYVKCNQYYYLGVNELYKALMGVDDEQ